jgi:hypothetical protein
MGPPYLITSIPIPLPLTLFHRLMLKFCAKELVALKNRRVSNINKNVATIITIIIPLPIFLEAFSTFLPAVENNSNPTKQKKQELNVLVNPSKLNFELSSQYCILLFPCCVANTIAKTTKKAKAIHLINADVLIRRL